MSEIAISIEGLSKQYRLGQRESYGSLRDSLMSALGAPARAARALTGARREAGDDAFWALRDVSFDVRHGEVVGIIGRNGAGKSTLLKILSRITRPTKGHVKIYGRLGSLLEVGTGFHPELTGRENIYLNGAILGMHKAEITRKFDEIVAFAEIEKFLDTPVKRYSSGMYVRLAFAVAAHLEPEILIIDEVLAVGDVAFQKKALAKMQSLSQEGGRTVLFVSHNLRAVSDLCTRALLISKGSLIQDASPHIIVPKYLSQGAAPGEIDLEHWTIDRTGGGPMRVLRVALRDSAGAIATRFAYGTDITFDLTLRGKKGAGSIIGVSVRDVYGTVVLHLTNTDDKFRVTFGSEEHRLLVKMRNILNDGAYFVTVWLGDEMNILHDRVGNCLEFTVETYETIRSRAIVRMPAVWSSAAENSTLYAEKGF